MTPEAARLDAVGHRLTLGRVLATNLGLALGLESIPLLALGLVPPLLLPWARRRGLTATPLAEGLAAAAGLAVGVPVFAAQGAAAPGLAAFLVVAQGLKLLAPRSPRDAGTAVVIGVVLLGVAASTAVHPLFGVLLLVTAVTSLLGLAAQTTAAVLAQGPAARPDRGLAAPPGAVRAARRPLAAIALVSLALFVSFPRVGAHLLPTSRDGRERLSGFTDLVGLDDIGRIQQNDQVAFRAELVSGALPEEPYWRGRVLDEYDGARWRVTRGVVFGAHRLDLAGDLTFEDRLLVRPAGRPSEVLVYQEPLGTRCLFTTGAVERLAFKSARPEVVDRDALGAVLALRPPPVPLAYRLVTHADVEVPSFLASRELGRRLEAACLAVPPVVDAERLRAFAREALARQGVDPGRAPPSQVAAALEAHLSTTLTYSLDAARTPGVEPVGAFLFEHRAGHCELFASSLVLLLRLQGIPARLVSGFRGGELNAWSRTWTVRQRDAHAWVEARTEAGWRRFDPTPAQADAGEGAGVWRAARHGLDWLELRWLQWVIAYDAYDQRLLLADLQRWVAGWLARGLLAADDVDAGPARAGARLLALVAAIGAPALVAAYLLRRRRRRDGAAAADHEPVVRQVLAALAARGVARRPHETLAEVAARGLAALGPAAAPLGPWVRARNARRWGGAGAGEAAEAEAARAALASLTAPSAN